MKKKPVDPIKDDVLFKEIAEDVKNEQLKHLWDKYGLLIILVVALSLTAAVSFETFKAWNIKQDEKLSNAYAVAISLQASGKMDESIKVLKNLKDRDNGIYTDIANLQLSNIYFEQGKSEKALKILNKMIEDSDTNTQMQEIATIKLASYLLDTNAPKEEISNLLSPLTKTDGKWANIAIEMLAMLAIRDGDIEQAKKQYEIIVNSPNEQKTLENRASDMLTILNEKI